MVIEFVTSRYFLSHELAQASFFCGIVAQVSDVVHGPLVSVSYEFTQAREWRCS